MVSFFSKVQWNLFKYSNKFKRFQLKMESNEKNAAAIVALLLLKKKKKKNEKKIHVVKILSGEEN